jgi:hypothetical protein
VSLSSKITTRIVQFTLNHFDPCLNTILEVAIIHDPMSSGVQSKTWFMRRILIYLILAIKNQLHIDPRFRSSYFSGVRGRGGTSARELVSPITEPNTLAVRGVNYTFTDSRMILLSRYRLSRDQGLARHQHRRSKTKRTSMARLSPKLFTQVATMPRLRSSSPCPQIPHISRSR